MPPTNHVADIDKLKARIQGLRAKTIENGCTEEEALSAAAKVAELLDTYDLSMTDVELRQEACERAEFETQKKQSLPLDACIPAIAEFADCKVWRMKNPDGAFRFVFFGMKHGLVHRRNLRLMKVQRNEAHKATGRDLVLVKATVIEDELAKLGMNFSTRRKGRRLVAKDAFDAGHAA